MVTLSQLDSQVGKQEDFTERGNDNPMPGAKKESPVDDPGGVC
jgi:hypothetical protein